MRAKTFDGNGTVLPILAIGLSHPIMLVLGMDVISNVSLIITAIFFDIWSAVEFNGGNSVDWQLNDSQEKYNMRYCSRRDGKNTEINNKMDHKTPGCWAKFKDAHRTKVSEILTHPVIFNNWNQIWNLWCRQALPPSQFKKSKRKRS